MDEPTARRRHAVVRFSHPDLVGRRDWGRSTRAHSAEDAAARVLHELENQLDPGFVAPDLATLEVVLTGSKETVYCVTVGSLRRWMDETDWIQSRDVCRP